jgi:hypothetical protein
MSGPSLVIRREKKQLSPSADKAALAGEPSELDRHVSVMFAPGRIGSR